MALKKVFENTSKYYYAVVDRFNYGKNARGSVSGSEHIIEVTLFVRDSDNTEYSVVENPLVYKIPTMKRKQVPIINQVPKINPKSGEQELDDKGNPIIEDVENGFKLETDDTYTDPFHVSNLSAQGIDPIHLSYEWLKNNILLFSDFVDVFEEGQNLLFKQLQKGNDE